MVRKFLLSLCFFSHTEKSIIFYLFSLTLLLAHRIVYFKYLGKSFNIHFRKYLIIYELVIFSFLLNIAFKNKRKTVYSTGKPLFRVIEDFYISIPFSLITNRREHASLPDISLYGIHLFRWLIL